MSKWQNNNKKKKKRNATILLTIKEIVKQIASRMRQGEEDNQINRTKRSKTMNLLSPSLRLHMKTFSVSYIYMENKYTKGSCCTSTNVADYTIHLLYHTLLHEPLLHEFVRLTKSAPHVTQISHILALRLLLCLGK